MLLIHDDTLHVTLASNRFHIFIIIHNKYIIIQRKTNIISIGIIEIKYLSNA